MDGYSSKLSLYDFIAMLMPGSIIVGVMIVLETDGNLCLPEKTMFWLFFFIASYLAGIINHIATSNLFALIQFKNCRLMLMNSRKQAKRKNYRTIHSESLISNKHNNCLSVWLSFILIAVTIVIVICGCIQCKEVSCIYSYSALSILLILIVPIVDWIRSKHCMKSLINKIKKRVCHKSQNQHLSSSKSVDEYYREYYYVKKEGYGTDIEVMEGQVAFLQSLILPLLLILCTQLCHSKNLLSIFGIDYKIINECFIPLMILIFIAVLVSIFSRQQKIYDRVWEDYNYLKKYYEKVKDEKRLCQ